MTRVELRETVSVMRELGVVAFEDGTGAKILLGPEPPQKASATTEPAPAPEPDQPAVGPDGKPMSDDDKVLFAHTLGAEDEP